MTIQTDCVIVGAGPCGLFAVFELGLLGIKAHVVDSLTQPGGQCSELYPDKPIYDIPAIPVCGAQELIDRLLQQTRPFEPEFHLGQEVTSFGAGDDGRFALETATGTRFDTATVIIAAGLGSFQPRSLRKQNVDKYENSTVHYRVKDPSKFAGKRIAILGGGDSALDWTLELVKIADHVTLVHRREEFRAAPASVNQMLQLVDEGRMDLVKGMIKGINEDADTLTGLKVKNFSDELVDVDAEEILCFYGLSPKLGPIADWGLDLDRNAIEVDTEKFETSIGGVFAVGDINTYPGKKKLILSGFHEGALAAYGVQKHLNPQAKQFVQYTTTSPLMHQRLGVEGG